MTTPTHRPLLTGRGDSRISEHVMRGMLRSVASKTAIALLTRSSWLYADWTSTSISFWRVADRRDLRNRQPTT